MQSLQNLSDTFLNLPINLIEQCKPPPIDGTLARRNLLHRLACLYQRQFHKARIVRIHAARLAPELTEIRLELPIHAHVIIRIIAPIRHRVDVPQPQRTRHRLRDVEDEILRAIAVTRLRRLLHHIACMRHIRSVQSRR